MRIRTKNIRIKSAAGRAMQRVLEYRESKRQRCRVRGRLQFAPRPDLLQQTLIEKITSNGFGQATKYGDSSTRELKVGGGSERSGDYVEDSQWGGRWQVKIIRRKAEPRDPQYGPDANLRKDKESRLVALEGGWPTWDSESTVRGGSVVVPDKENVTRGSYANSCSVSLQTHTELPRKKPNQNQTQKKQAAPPVATGLFVVDKWWIFNVSTAPLCCYPFKKQKTLWRRLPTWLGPGSRAERWGCVNRDTVELRLVVVWQFTAAFIDANPVIFANTGWVHPGQLRTFLASKSLAVSVKTEVPDASSVKPEPSVILLPPRLRQPVVPFRTRNLVEGGTDIIEILSSDDESEVETSPRAALASSDPPEPSSGLPTPAPPSPAPFDSSDPPQHLELSDNEPEGSAPMALSETEWYNPDIISRVIIGPAEINRQNKVGRVEYLTEIPSYFPVFREPTAIVIDMRHEKFNFYDTDGVLLEPDTLILDQNQESWSTSSGGGDHHPTCLLFNGTKVKCRRARHTCNGCYRCSELDPSLVNVTRFEIDTSTRAKVISAEVVTRLAEGDTPEKLVAAFHRVVMSRKCKARDHIGAPCDGHPKMIRRINGSLRKAHFIGCSSWSRTWRDHPADSIPDNIDETLLAELMSPQGAFTSGSTTAECSRIGSSRVGERQPFCAHIHLKDGKSVRGQMLHHPCKTYMTIYVPLDSSLRMACVTFNPAKPHTHPMGPMTKITLDVKEAYRKCVRAAGVLGTTVQRVDDAPTTLLLLNGQSPAMYHPSLHRKRLKQGLIRDEKLKISPEGLGVAAIYARHVRDLKLPPEERYVQNVIIWAIYCPKIWVNLTTFGWQLTSSEFTSLRYGLHVALGIDGTSANTSVPEFTGNGCLNLLSP
ncbi:hypothetical protein B0H16DRAFT_1795087 [Mycena metata]|uniref:Uncharacterized protein n=1 Tax=Mycena metata TaxID=1033252 RepID=A0AAD7HFF3_9AGAR|nr:hypothetical protein B0H16DRAFT_1795087 [Mycena metata]